jgi:hypothetical protein
MIDAPVHLSLRTARGLALLVPLALAIGYVGGAALPAPDGSAPLAFSVVRLLGLCGAIVLFLDVRGQRANAGDAMLDERERADRDRAYVVTHRVMVGILFAAFIYLLAAKLAKWGVPDAEATMDLLSAFAIGSMALPGMILAWREQPDDGE